MQFAEHPINQSSPDERIYLQITKALFLKEEKSEDSIDV